MREVKCAETGHVVHLDETTGKIAGFDFSNDAGRRRVVRALDSIAHGNPLAGNLDLLALRGVEVDIVASAFAEWTNDRTTRWRIDDSGRLVPTWVA